MVIVQERAAPIIVAKRAINFMVVERNGSCVGENISQLRRAPPAMAAILSVEVGYQISLSLSFVE